MRLKILAFGASLQKNSNRQKTSACFLISREQRLTDFRTRNVGTKLSRQRQRTTRWKKSACQKTAAGRLWSEYLVKTSKKNQQLSSKLQLLTVVATQPSDAKDFLSQIASKDYKTKTQKNHYQFSEIGQNRVDWHWLRNNADHFAHPLPLTNPIHFGKHFHNLLHLGDWCAETLGNEFND